MYQEENIIILYDVSVRFNMAAAHVDNLKEYVIKLIKKELIFKEFFALRHINLSIKRGESWGIIGKNGSGKSTLLKLVCNIFVPYTGNIKIRGSIAPLIELGAGFDGNLSGRENIFLNGALLGYSKKYMEEHFKEIVDFAELDNFIEVPVKNYSSGMRARLGFSIATAVHADILIVDEVLSVGDYTFRKKCEQKIADMLLNGTTLLYVSHSIDSVKKLCKKTLWLDEGRIIQIGDTEKICDTYLHNNKKQEAK